VNHALSGGLALALMSIAGCVFYPGISAKDDRFFTDPPYIAAGAKGYRLAWRYGSLGCAFYPEGKVV